MGRIKKLGGWISFDKNGEVSNAFLRNQHNQKYMTQTGRNYHREMFGGEIYPCTIVYEEPPKTPTPLHKK